MKKYVNGKYVEMTPEEISEWEEGQEVAENTRGGVMELIESYAAEVGGTTFDIPVGKQFKDVLIQINLSLTRVSALKISFDSKEVLFVTTGTFLTESNTLQLFAHDIGGYIEGGVKKVSYGTQIGALQTFNGLFTKGMPEAIRLSLYPDSENSIKAGKAEVYAR